MSFKTCKTTFSLMDGNVIEIRRKGRAWWLTPVIPTIAISELLTMNNIKLFGTTIQENINNSMWNYGAALSLIMLFLIGASTLIAGDGSKQEGGIR